MLARLKRQTLPARGRWISGLVGTRSPLLASPQGEELGLEGTRLPVRSGFLWRLMWIWESVAKSVSSPAFVQHNPSDFVGPDDDLLIGEPQDSPTRLRQ